ncbi:MAG: pyridoxal phosphate-dependent aminotransferase [Lachnospiraceae bacterium]|nr:pyridoxal phosphate-dependent aminotransferase [Lachnospiraceae bacterium]
MISQKMVGLVKGSSVIRAMFEEGKQMAAKYGAENVFDFSLGNPNVPAPAEVNEAILEIVKDTDPVKLHGYMSNAGHEEVRKTIADSLNKRFGTSYNEQNIIMTVGAAGGLNVALKAILNPGDEVIAFAPYFGEYNNYVSNFDGKMVIITPDTKSFQPNLSEFEQKITNKTACVIVNSPNNPTGVIYSEETLEKMGEILERKQKELGRTIYLITDEPYRELAYDGAVVPWVPLFYRNTIVGYSYSKSLSLPGERIGYLVIPKEADDFEDLAAAAGVATRILGFVNAPSIMQLVIERCIDCETDLSYYDRNRNTLYEGLTKLGFTCQKPEGAFYLFMKSPIEDEKEFVSIAKKYNLLMVPGSTFMCPGFVRIAYCVSYETVTNSLKKFEELAKELKLFKG